MIRFAVELDEKEMTGNKKFSGEQLFKSAGVTKVVAIDMFHDFDDSACDDGVDDDDGDGDGVDVDDGHDEHPGGEIKCKRLYSGLPLGPCAPGEKILAVQIALACYT